MKNSALFKHLACVLGVAVLMGASFIQPAPAEAADKTFITIGTGGETGVYYPVGGAICRSVNKDRKNHNIDCKHIPTGASVYNINAIRSGDISMGIAQSDTQYYASKGTFHDAFVEAGPYEDLRVLFTLHAEAFTLVARDDANINSFDDLKGKRVNIGDPGSGNRNTMELLMKEYGWTSAVYDVATELTAKEMASALCDDNIQAYVYVVGHPNASIQEAANTCKSHIVSVTGPNVDTFMEKFPFYPKAVIPGGMYTGTPDDVTTFGPRATLVTSAQLPDEIAYEVVKAVFNNLEEFRKLHPALANLTKEEMLLGNSVEFHPGAVKYFKEVGLMK